MLTVILVGTMSLAFSFQSLFSKMYGNRSKTDAALSPFVFSVLYGALIAIITFCISGFSYNPTKNTLLLGLLTAVIYIIYNIMILRATASGPYPTLMVFLLSGGIMIPLLYESLVYHTKLTILQYIGIAVMFAAIVLLTREGKNEEKVKPIFWFYCVCLFLTNGFYGEVIAIQQRLEGEAQRTAMVISLFSMTAILGLIVVGVMLLIKRKPVKTQIKEDKFSLLYGSLAAVSATGGQNLMLYCLTLVPTAILYTIDNGLALILSVVYALILFKEKITKIKMIGIITAIASIIMMSI